MRMKLFSGKRILLMAALLAGIAVAGTWVFSRLDSSVESAPTSNTLPRPVKTIVVEESPITEALSLIHI